jgi:hypothetical protein
MHYLLPIPSMMVIRSVLLIAFLTQNSLTRFPTANGNGYQYTKHQGIPDIFVPCDLILKKDVSRSACLTHSKASTNSVGVTTVGSHITDQVHCLIPGQMGYSIGR